MNAWRLWIAAILTLFASGCSQSDYAYVKEGETYALQIVRFVGWQWKADELISKADPRMLQAISETDIQRMMAECASRLGTLQKVSPVAEEISVSTVVGGKSALYVFDATGQKGSATIRVRVQKQGDGWAVLGFWVDPKSPSSPVAANP